MSSNLILEIIFKKLLPAITGKQKYLFSTIFKGLVAGSRKIGRALVASLNWRVGGNMLLVALLPPRYFPWLRPKIAISQLRNQRLVALDAIFFHQKKNTFENFFLTETRQIHDKFFFDSIFMPSKNKILSFDLFFDLKNDFYVDII